MPNTLANLHIFGVVSESGRCLARFFSFSERSLGRKEEILEKVRNIAAPLAAQEGLELVDVELGGAGGRQTLRLFIDKPGGVSLEDCSSVSRAVSAALDVEDPLAGAYDLEVSSPGLDRPLRTPEHFEKYKGEKVRVKTFGPVPECENRKTFVGTLQGYSEGKVVVDVDGKVFHVPHAQVSKANVEPQFD
jgi:ribosome maturation factor RimP